MTGNKIRLSSVLLGLQFFTFFINFTGWDSIGFCFPIWLVYIFLRILEIKKENKTVSFEKSNIPIIIWMLYSTYQGIVHYQDYDALKITFFYFLGGLTFLVIIHSRLSEREIFFILKMYIFMAVIASLLLFVQHQPFPGYNNRFTVVIFGGLKDPNYFSAYLMFPCLVCMFMYIKHHKIYMLAFFAIITIAIWMTGSRSSFLALILGLLLIIIPEMKKARTFYRVLFLTIIALILFFTILPENLLSRFLNLETYNDGSNLQRYNIWKTAFNIWKTEPIFGKGQNVVSNYGIYYGATRHMMTHCTWLDIAAELGLTGLLLFISVPVNIFFRAIKRKSFIILSLLISTLATSTIISSQYSQYYWINMSIMLSVLYNGIKDEDFVNLDLFGRAKNKPVPVPYYDEQFYEFYTDLPENETDGVQPGIAETETMKHTDIPDKRSVFSTIHGNDDDDTENKLIMSDFDDSELPPVGFPIYEPCNDADDENTGITLTSPAKAREHTDKKDTDSTETELSFGDFSSESGNKTLSADTAPAEETDSKKQNSIDDCKS